MIATRNPTPYVLAAALASVFPVVWIANWLGYSDVDGGKTILAALFVWLFAVPAMLFSFYSCSVVTPYIELVGTEVRFCSMNTPWKVVRIQVSDILEISTLWLPNTTHSMISLRLSDDAYQKTAGDWTWAKRAKGWVYFQLVNSATDPHKAAKKLSGLTGIHYAIEDYG